MHALVAHFNLNNNSLSRSGRYTRAYPSLVVIAVCVLASLLGSFFLCFRCLHELSSVSSQGTLPHLNILHYAHFAPCTFSFSSVSVQVQVGPFHVNE